MLVGPEHSNFYGVYLFWHIINIAAQTLADCEVDEWVKNEEWNGRDGSL